ncbi:MAG: hypothetical protein LC104_14470 [Bacteroidales bacterium]|nr:hypothetical protein [Bacteroidales bacterium]
MNENATGKSDCVVVKVGGSLYDHPYLQPGLREYLAGIAAEKILVVAGGGSIVEAVRKLDRHQNLGEPLAHQLALLGCQLTTHWMRSLLGIETVTAALEWHAVPHSPRIMLLNSSEFLTQYEKVYGGMPHTWAVTSDSIAACAARVAQARLVLLKSVDVSTEMPWEDVAAHGAVDAYFPVIASTLSERIERIHFRRWLDERCSQQKPSE